MGASVKENTLPFSLLCRLRSRKSSNDNYSFSLIVSQNTKPNLAKLLISLYVFAQDCKAVRQ